MHERYRGNDAVLGLVPTFETLTLMAVARYLSEEGEGCLSEFVYNPLHSLKMMPP